MKQQKNRILTDELYNSGTPVDFSDSPPSICNAIESVSATATKEAVRGMLAYAHYIKTSHLLLCEKVWRYNTSPELNEVSQQFFDRTSDEATVWGKYMVQAGGAGTIDPGLRQFYNVLFSNDDPVFTMFAVATVDTATLPLLRRMQADDLFNEVTDTVARKREQQFPTHQQQFRCIVEDMATDERRRLFSALGRPIDLIQTLVREQQPLLQRLNVQYEPCLEEMRTRLDTFYNEVGLVVDEEVSFQE